MSRIDRNHTGQRRVSTLFRLWVISACAAGALATLPRIASPQDAGDASDIDALRSRIEELTRLAVRTQSHVMVDVEYHFSNLWFAVHDEQWDLASFYLRETDSHLGWTVRMRPVRSLRGGGTVDLQPFRDSIEAAGFAQIEDTIERKDVTGFEAAYRQTLAQCYACHQASGLPYLEPRIPEKPLSPLMVHPK